MLSENSVGLLYRFPILRFACSYFPMWYPGSGVVLDCTFPGLCHLSYFEETNYSNVKHVCLFRELKYHQKTQLLSCIRSYI